MNKIESCGKDQVIQLSDDWSAELDADCNVVTKGCAYVKAFKTAIGKYKATKPPLPPFVGEMDLCEAVEQYAELLDPFFEMLHLPKRCPVEPVSIDIDF